MTDTAKLAAWFASEDTGLSSKALAAHMAGADMSKVPTSRPYDPADLGRCLRLLEIFPEWKPRLSEMAAYGNWKRILPHWNEVAAKMAEEVGIDWSKGRSAPETYDLMKVRGF